MSMWTKSNVTLAGKQVSSRTRAASARQLHFIDCFEAFCLGRTQYRTQGYLTNQLVKDTHYHLEGESKQRSRPTKTSARAWLTPTGVLKLAHVSLEWHTSPKNVAALEVPAALQVMLDKFATTFEPSKPFSPSALAVPI